MENLIALPDDLKLRGKFSQIWQFVLLRRLIPKSGIIIVDRGNDVQKNWQGARRCFVVLSSCL